MGLIFRRVSMSDTKIEQQGVSISFNQRDFVPATYLFEMDDRTDIDQTTLGVVRIRKYPAAPGVLNGLFGPTAMADTGINIVVTEGSIEYTSEMRTKEVMASTVVNGAAEISLPYPVVGELSYSIDGRVYDRYGIERAVNIGYDSRTNKIILSRPCYCKVQYSYITSYQILRYTPNIYNDIETYYMPDPNDYGQLLGFVRTPINYEPEAPIVFSISPPESIASEFELYRIESTAFAKDDGLWEKPMGWPNGGSYPNSDSTLDSNESYIEIARTHEIGYFSLLNNPRRMETTQSSQMDTLPLDFKKELTLANYAGSTIKSATANTVNRGDGSSVNMVLSTTVKVQQKEHFDKYKRLLNRAPKMRTVHYDVPVAEPYGSETAINEAREVVRTVSTMNVVGADGSTADRTVITPMIKEFRIKLTVKAPTRPTISATVLRSRSNDSNTDFNIQAQRINTMLSLIWEGVDWNHLRRRILAAYSSDIYQVTFDSSFPSSI